jgi:hypothetical protein
MVVARAVNAPVAAAAVTADVTEAVTVIHLTEAVAVGLVVAVADLLALLLL